MKTRWKVASKRKPPHGNMVLVCGRTGDGTWWLSVAAWFKKEKQWALGVVPPGWENARFARLEYWMELPAPPEFQLFSGFNSSEVEAFVHKLNVEGRQLLVPRNGEWSAGP